jgi:hypothetical protein
MFVANFMPPKEKWLPPLRKNSRCNHELKNLYTVESLPRAVSISIFIMHCLEHSEVLVWWLNHLQIKYRTALKKIKIKSCLKVMSVTEHKSGELHWKEVQLYIPYEKWSQKVIKLLTSAQQSENLNVIYIHLIINSYLFILSRNIWFCLIQFLYKIGKPRISKWKSEKDKVKMFLCLSRCKP